jgi:hypothetical protein
VWIDPVTQQVYRTPAALASAFPGVSWPSAPTASTVQAHGLEAVQTAPMPAFDAWTQICAEGAPERVDGAWVQTWIVTDRPSDNVRAELHARRKRVRTDEETAGFTYRGQPIDSDRDSILRLTQAAAVAMQALSSGAEYAVAWSGADGVDLPLDAAGVIGLQQALAAHGAACHDRSQARKARIDAATDLSALVEIAAELAGP